MAPLWGDGAEDMADADWLAAPAVFVQVDAVGLAGGTGTTPDWLWPAIDGQLQQLVCLPSSGVHVGVWCHEPGGGCRYVLSQLGVLVLAKHACEASGGTGGHGGVLPFHGDAEQRSTCGTPLYCSKEPNTHRHVVLPLGGAVGLVADVAVDLVGELLVAQAQGHHIGGDVVQQLSGVATRFKSSGWMASTTASRIAGASSRMIWRKQASSCAS